MWRRDSDFKRPHFHRQKPLGTRAEADEDAFTRLQLRKPIAAQRLHMDEDVLRALSLGEKSEPARAVKPFYNCNLKRAGLEQANTGARQLPLRGVQRI